MKKQAVLNNITKSLSIEDANDVDIVIEAAVENMEIKQSIFKQLDEITPKHAILATNTSSLTNYRNCSSNKSSRTSNWYAFYESSSSDEISRNYSWTCNIGRSIYSNRRNDEQT